MARRTAPPDDRPRTQARNPSHRAAAIGDKEMDKATWRKPRGIRLTPTSRYIRDKPFPKRGKILPRSAPLRQC